MYKISHCSSGHKTAAVNKLLGELPTAPCSRGCMKTPLVGRFQTSSCTTGALPSQREYRPEDVDSLHSWTTIFLKIFGTYYYNISRIHLKHTHFSCFHAKNWPPFPFPSSTTPNSLAFAVTFCSQEIYISGKLQHWLLSCWLLKPTYDWQSLPARQTSKLFMSPKLIKYCLEHSLPRVSAWAELILQAQHEETAILIIL